MSISFRNAATASRSSWECFSAACRTGMMADTHNNLECEVSRTCTLAALETISEFNSLHFLISRFSLSCDFLSAR